MTTRPKAYLAGPAVFHPAHKALFDYLKDICAEHGLEGISPMDGSGNLATLPPTERARIIRQNNLEKIRSSQVVIACTSPFRGPSADVGTAWEMGFAEALGIPVVAWSEDQRPYHDRVEHQRDQDGRAFCTQHGMLVEDLGLGDNLMLDAGAHPVQPDFDKAVALAASLTGATGKPPAAKD